MNNKEMTYADLRDVQKYVYEPAQLSYSKAINELESQEYSACEFTVNNKKIKFRTGKITPRKIGQFVTLWKRIGKGPTMPHDQSDPIDLFVVSVRTATHFGQFVFPKSVLCEKGIVSINGKGGKRGIRVYPAWDIAENALYFIT